MPLQKPWRPLLIPTSFLHSESLPIFPALWINLCNARYTSSKIFRFRFRFLGFHQRDFLRARVAFYGNGVPYIYTKHSRKQIFGYCYEWLVVRRANFQLDAPNSLTINQHSVNWSDSQYLRCGRCAKPAQDCILRRATDEHAQDGQCTDNQNYSCHGPC